ncbi:MAG: hypothetical protein L0241_18780 [Planctomycetia bacterium]|nr:hypothetical protein [Planctomycetia bacterium]
MTRKVIRVGAIVMMVAGLCVSVSQAEWPRHTARPKARCGIPGYDYRLTSTTPAPTATAVSLTKVNVTPAAVPGQPARPITLMYQLVESRIQVDHCFLSRVAVALHEDGSYQISFRADQNPQPGNDLRSPLKPGEKLNIPLQTSHLKRNLFVVKVRGFAASPVRPEQPNLALGAPVVVEFPVQEFWVQNGEPVSKSINGYSAAVQKYFPLIDRIEVEFTYR